MARARLIKPGFFSNAELSELSAHGRLLFIGLWTLADRDGRLKDEPRYIKGQLFPYENVPVDRLLKSLDERGFIVRYEVEGGRYIQVAKFAKHQNPHVREPASTIPAPGLAPGEHSASPGFSGTGPAVSDPVTDPVTSDPVAVAESGAVAPPPLPDLGQPDAWESVRPEFENTFGLVGGVLVTEAREYARVVPKAWFVQALEETRTKAEKPAWKYTKAILDRCLAEQQPPTRPRDGPREGSARAQMLQRYQAARSAAR